MTNTTQNDTMSETIEKLQQDPFYIKNINNPTTEQQSLAVSLNGISIKYIQNPSTQIQKLAIDQYLYSIYHINNPPLEIIEYTLNKIIPHKNNYKTHYLQSKLEEKLSHLSINQIQYLKFKYGINN